MGLKKFITQQTFYFMNNSGRTTDEQFWKSMYGGTSCKWDDNYGNSSSYGTSYYDYDFDSRSTKRRHKFSPVLLIFSTVYNCEHCGAKKEDCLTDFCEDKQHDFGDWG